MSNKELFKIFNMLAVDFVSLINEKYGGTMFRDSQVSKFDSFCSVYQSMPNHKLESYLDEVCDHALKDDRSPSDYGKEVMRGWLIEDAVEAMLTSCGSRVVMVGCDKGREFYELSNMRNLGEQTPDLLVDDRYIEVICCWGDYWEKSDRLDLRLNKVKMLIRHRALLFGLCPATKQLLVIDFHDLEEGDFRARHVSGYAKRGYTLIGISGYLGEVDSQINKVLHKTRKELSYVDSDG